MTTPKNKVMLFLLNCVSNIILDNKIVATILYHIGKQCEEFNTKIDNVLNTDI